jgi:uncharacterized protein YciI
VKYLLFYDSAGDVAEKAPLHIEEHRALWHRFATDGRLLMVGPLADRSGAVSVFTTEEAAREFVAADPFVRHGVVKDHRIVAWMEALVPEPE